MLPAVFRAAAFRGAPPAGLLPLVPMVKADLVNKAAKAAGVTKTQAAIAIEALFDSIKDSLLRGERIELRGFGVFEVKAKKTGIGRNPKTGDEMPIPAGKAIRFKPGKEIRIL